MYAYNIKCPPHVTERAELYQQTPINLCMETFCHPGYEPPGSSLDQKERIDHIHKKWRLRLPYHLANWLKGNENIEQKVLSTGIDNI